MNTFGGEWTENKMKILVEYARAYLTIMKDRPFFKLLYFDGFAGSGFIEKEKTYGVEVTVGAAKRIIEINDPRPFDEYYFVEKKKKNFDLLKTNTKDMYPQKRIHATCGDCNKKLKDLAVYLKKPQNSKVRTLAYIDPCGMQVEWSAIESLKGLPIDMWILVPTGMGVNRLLTTNGRISSAWLQRLEIFLGMTTAEIEGRFYKKSATLFDNITNVQKEKDAIDKSATIYQSRLKEIFECVSRPYELKNSTKGIMYHLFLTSNNKAAEKIANDIVSKYNK